MTSASAPRPRLMGATLVPLAEAGDTAGTHEAFRLDLDPGARSPLHALPGSKLFVVLEGEVVVVEGGTPRSRTAGETVFVPAGTPHCYANESGAPARLVVVTSGTGQLAFLRGMAELAAHGRPDPEAVRRHAEQHGVRLLQAA